MSCGGTTSPSSSSSWTPFSSYYERIITRSPSFTSITMLVCWTSGGLLWTGYPAAIVSVLPQLCTPVTQIFPITAFTVSPQSELNNSSPLTLKTACFLHRALKDTSDTYWSEHCWTCPFFTIDLNILWHFWPINMFNYLSDVLHIISVLLTFNVFYWCNLNCSRQSRLMKRLIFPVWSLHSWIPLTCRSLTVIARCRWITSCVSLAVSRQRTSVPP